MLKNVKEKKCGQKLVHHMIKGSFHQGSLYIFDTQTAGHQCVPKLYLLLLLMPQLFLFLSGQEKVLVVFYVVEMHCTKKFKQTMIFCKFMKLGKKFCFWSNFLNHH